MKFFFSVLNPDNASAQPNPTASTASPAFSGASSTDGVPFTSGIAVPPAATASATSSGSSPVSTEPVAGGQGKVAAIGAAALFGAGAVALMNQL